jgi:hypothetical protein
MNKPLEDILKDINTPNIYDKLPSSSNNLGYDDDNTHNIPNKSNASSYDDDNAHKSSINSYHRSMLRSTIKNGENLYDLLQKHEEDKRSLRKLIFIPLMSLLGVFLLTFITMLIKNIHISNATIIGLFSTIITSIISILIIFSKYATSSDYIKSYESISKTQLEYLMSNNVYHSINKRR